VTSPPARRPTDDVDVDVDVDQHDGRRPADPVMGTDGPHTTYLIGRLDRIVRRALEERLRSHGVTLLGYTALTVLAARPGLSNAQLARRSFMTPQGMNQAVAVLAERGLIRRSPDSTNRRRRRIELTDLGRRTVDVCSADVEEYEQVLLDSLDPHRRGLLNDLLRTVVDANRQRDRESGQTAR
jgi:DNA-binding MarR family transcriptional regulator